MFDCLKVKRLILCPGKVYNPCATAEYPQDEDC